MILIQIGYQMASKFGKDWAMSHVQNDSKRVNKRVSNDVDVCCCICIDVFLYHMDCDVFVCVVFWVLNA
jgi:hypothetical protein